MKVNKDGCPIDSDGDGVPDYLDKCPDTPKGVKVDKDGCPIPEQRVPQVVAPPAAAAVAAEKDSDNDGVPDSRDKCPDTPAGATRRCGQSEVARYA